MNLDQLANFFWSLENRFNLLDFQINEVKVWQYQRSRIFNELATATGLFHPPHSKKIKSTDILKASLSLLKYAIFSNPLSGNYTKENLLFNSGRKTNVDGQLTDIYLKYFIEDEKLPDYEIIEELFENKHLTNERKNRKHQDYQQIRTFILSSMSFFRFSDEENSVIDAITERIKAELNIQYNLKDRLRNGYLNFIHDYSFYIKLLKKRRPEKVYIVCSYGYKKALISAAKTLEINTIELQHGTIDKYHMGYNYRDKESVDYFPDRLYLFGQYWKDALEFPISKENIFVKGFPYFNIQKQKYNSLQKIENQVLIISQGTIGKQLSEMFISKNELLKNYELIYKLHPGEYSRWKSEYPELAKLNKLENFRIIDNNDQSLYYYLGTSKYVIGVYSTAIYEALAFDCKVVLIKLAGIEYMSGIIERQLVKVASKIEEIVEHFSCDNVNNFPTSYFFG